MLHSGRPRLHFTFWEKRELQSRSWFTAACPECFGAEGALGFNLGRYIRGYGYLEEIHVAGSSLSFVHASAPRHIMATLLHEMTHAYIDLFLCHCRSCTADITNTFGCKSHGAVFMMLLDCIDQTMRSWMVGLYALGDCEPVPGLPPELTLGDEFLEFIWEETFLRPITQPREVVKWWPIAPLSELELPEPAINLPEVTSAPEPTDKEGKKRLWGRMKPAGKEKPALMPYSNIEYNKLRQYYEREPGAQVYVKGLWHGATRVKKTLLDRRAVHVQALIAEADKKREGRLNLRWPGKDVKGKTE